MNVGPSTAPKVWCALAPAGEKAMIWPGEYVWMTRVDQGSSGLTLEIPDPHLVLVEDGRVALTISARSRPDILTLDAYRAARNVAVLPHRIQTYDLLAGDLGADLTATARTQHLSFEAPGPEAPHLRLTVGYRGRGGGEMSWARYFIATAPAQRRTRPGLLDLLARRWRRTPYAPRPTEKEEDARQ